MNSCPPSADSTGGGGGGGGGGVLSAFGRFNGEVTVIDRAHAHAQNRRDNLLISLSRFITIKSHGCLRLGIRFDN